MAQPSLIISAPTRCDFALPVPSTQAPSLRSRRPHRAAPLAAHPRNELPLGATRAAGAKHACAPSSVWGQRVRIAARGRPQRIAPGSQQSPVALFTGIVEEMGEVKRLEEVEEEGKLGWVLEVTADETLKGSQLGDSIAVNGTCLTITTLTAHSTFTFGVSPETLRCTSLGELQAGSPVNLERSLRPDSRMGGHFVQGHVDATGTVREFWTEGDSLWVRVEVPRDLMPYIVPKGYIAVDGTSLTVCEVNDKDSTFTFMLVAYTQQKIVVPRKSVGNKVNLEVDILGKYVVRVMNTMKSDLSAQLSQ